MFSSQPAFAGGPCLEDDDCGASTACIGNAQCGRVVIGICDYQNINNGGSCGSSSDTACDNPDTCSGGSCQSNTLSIGTSCDDSNSCTGNGICLVGGLCSTGLPANSGGNCGSGSGTCSNQDTCAGVFCLPNDHVTGTSCTGSNSNACLDACDGIGNCMNNVPGTGGSCNDFNECTSGGTNDVCATGLCVPRSLDSGGSCGDDTDTECANPDSCSEGVCVSNDPPPGTECDNGDGLECTGLCDGFGTCGDGPVVFGFNCDDGFACTVGDFCDAGLCIGTPTDNACCTVGFPANEGGNCGAGSTQCSAQDTCDDGSCQPNDQGDGTTCGDAGTQCTNQDTCQGGNCVDAGIQSEGTTCGAEGTECSAQDTCSNGQCVLNDLGDGTTCGDAGTECTNQDTCQGGNCVDAGQQSAGTACGSPGDSECSNPDTCFNGQCILNDETDGIACGDAGTECTNQDTCQRGNCFDAGFATTGTECEADGDECTGPDTCDGTGACAAGPPVDIPACFPVGGQIIPIESTSLILAGTQTFSWMIPVVLSVVGIGLLAVTRKSE